MTDLTLAKSDLTAFLDKLAESRSVWAPAKKNGYVDYRRYDGSEIPTEKERTRLSIKGFFLKQREDMLAYTTDPKAINAGIMEEIKPDEPTVVFGVSPCDARSVLLNALVFVNDPNNPNQCPYYQARMDQTVLIGLGCNQPCATCFCHATGGHPLGEEGLDALMVDLDDRYLVKVLTQKGADALAGTGLAEAPEGDQAEADRIGKNALVSMARGLKLGQASGHDQMDLFELPLWEQTAARCLNCGVCTFICPTCYCFDIQDENDGSDGVRYRMWDSCMFPLYTRHASGHNPRPTKKERVRNRFMHKLKYFPDRYQGKLSCVGCGRCVIYCPVNIDIREMAAGMKPPAKAADESAEGN